MSYLGFRSSSTLVGMVETDPLATPDGVLEMRRADFWSEYILVSLSTCLDSDDKSEIDNSLMGA